jgi:D-alanyl-lipoteichoic acid acyltransferase DltB (MBOAT superfamily)
MLPALAGAVALTPLYWLAVPAPWRRDVLAAASLAGLAWLDPRLVVLVAALTAGLVVLPRVTAAGARRLLVVAALAALAALFFWNKAAGHGGGPLPSQGAIALLGVSYVVLKAAALLVDAGRGDVTAVGARDVVAWLAFLPTYPSGPIEDFEHFRTQTPAFDRARALGGLERILFGLVKALVVADALGTWVDPIVAQPAAHGRGVLLLALYAASVRFYLDFSGYSDVAIGVAALYGYEIAENFDHPFLRRNLVQLWQHWHMTLTGWLRTYLFIPLTRLCIRRGGRAGERVAPVAGQLVTMTFCGLWHGVGWNFVLWGFLHGLGLVWVGVVARDLGRRLPAGLVGWWRRSPLARGVATATTFTVFSLLLVFVLADARGAGRYLARLAGVTP